MSGTTATDETVAQRRAEAAQHATTVRISREGWLRTKRGFCFGGALCDYAAAQPDYSGGWERDPGGRWHFIDQSGRPHDHHMPVDVRSYLGMTDAESATIIEENDVERATGAEMSRRFRQRGASTQTDERERAQTRRIG